MSPLVAVSLLFASFVLHTNGQNECDKYIVTVSQENYLENDNIKLHCTFNESVDYSSISWQIKNGTKYRQAYRDYNKDFPNSNGPEQEFKGKLNGSIEDNTHTLTILNATLNDKLDVWLCAVYTVNCTSGVQAEWNLNLTKAEWIMELYTDDTLFERISSNSRNVYTLVANINIDPIYGWYSKTDVNVTCVSESHRKPVDLYLIDVEADSANCLPIAGPYPQPWSCLVTGIVSKGFTLKKQYSDVFCVIEFNSEPPIANDQRLIVVMELRPGEIVFAVFLSIVSLACVVRLMWFIKTRLQNRNKKRPNTSAGTETSCDAKGHVQ